MRTAAPAFVVRPNWPNIAVVASAHALAAVAVAYLITVRASALTLGLAGVWLLLSGLAVTAGYHRLFAHRSYSAGWPLRLLYLGFGAAAMQNSARAWCTDHRAHHAWPDQERDPYSIERGFWWAHIGWVLTHPTSPLEKPAVEDLGTDALVRFQHRWYVAVALAMGLLLPTSLGALWGDALGALLVAGLLRVVVLWHLTFSINSAAHTFGARPYCRLTSARDNGWLALFSLGEGYHNFHHRFPADYRNGVRAYQFDPTKWFIWLLARVGLARDLKRVPARAIMEARRSHAASEDGREGISRRAAASRAGPRADT